MTAETVGEPETGHIRSFAQNGVVIRCHLVQTSPSAARVYFDRFQTGYTAHGACENLFDECRIEVRVEAISFVGIVPGHEDAETFRPKMKARGHIDGHGR